jgi:hypothetical protein
MNYNDLRFSKWRLVMAVLFALGVQSALANDAPLVSGSAQEVRILLAPILNSELTTSRCRGQRQGSPTL